MQPTTEPYIAIGIVILIAVGMAGGMLVLAHVLGPKRRHGDVKDSPYESGMPIIVGTDRRFNIRFYVVAMLFLLFDVEIVFIWPWAVAFYEAATKNTVVSLGGDVLAGKGFLLAGMGMFFMLLLFGLVYEWLKGAFEWN